MCNFDRDISRERDDSLLDRASAFVPYLTIVCESWHDFFLLYVKKISNNVLLVRKGLTRALILSFARVLCLYVKKIQSSCIYLITVCIGLYAHNCCKSLNIKYRFHLFQIQFKYHLSSLIMNTFSKAVFLMFVASAAGKS